MPTPGLCVRPWGLCIVNALGLQRRGLVTLIAAWDRASPPCFSCSAIDASARKRYPAALGARGWDVPTLSPGQDGFELLRRGKGLTALCRRSRAERKSYAEDDWWSSTRQVALPRRCTRHIWPAWRAVVSP